MKEKNKFSKTKFTILFVYFFVLFIIFCYIYIYISYTITGIMPFQEIINKIKSVTDNFSENINYIFKHIF